MSSGKNTFNLKPLFASLLLALGISPLAEADEVYENYNGYNQQTFYAPQLTLGGFYGNKGGSYGEGDILYPLLQDPSQLFYTDIRAQKDNASMWQAALGFGYRFLSSDAQQLYGAYAFYNYENSYLNNDFQQIITGLEFKTNYIGARANYYHSVGPTQFYEPRQNGITFSSVGGINYNMLVANAYEGQVIQGGDAEIGGPIPYVAGLRLFGGYYHFVSNVGQSVIAGPSARVEYRLEEALNLQMPFVDRLTLEGTWQHDQVNGSLWTVGVRLTLPLGYRNNNTGLQKEMTDYVRFNQLPAPYVGYDAPTPAQTNGHNTVIAFVNNPTDFNTALNSTEDVMVINQNLTLTQGNGQLPNNVLVTGQNYEYSPGLTINMTGKNTVSSISAPNGQSVFYIGQNNTIQDLQVNQAISNNLTTYNSVGTLTINNITSTNGGIYIDVRDSGTNSNIAINASNFTLNNSGEAIGIHASSASTMNINSIQNNTITAGTGVSNAKGIALSQTSLDTLSLSNINNNTITFQAGNGNTGIFVLNAGIANTTGSPNGITNNTIVIGDSTGTGDSQGIWIQNVGAATQVIDSISNNNITLGTSESNEFDGILIDTISGGTQHINFIDGNNITVNNTMGAGQNINGINIQAPNGTQDISNLINNVFYFNGSAEGVTTINVLANNGGIEVNNFYNNAFGSGSTNTTSGIALSTLNPGTITISTGVNTPGNANGLPALMAANNEMNASENFNTEGSIIITDN